MEKERFEDAVKINKRISKVEDKLYSLHALLSGISSYKISVSCNQRTTEIDNEIAVEILERLIEYYNEQKSNLEKEFEDL